MAYSVKFDAKALRQFNALSSNVAQRLRKAIDGLIIEPRPKGVKKLKSNDERYRIRVGDYRVVYKIQDNVLVVIVVEIGHRREVYR